MKFNIYENNTDRCKLLAVVNGKTANDAINAVKSTSEKIAFAVESSSDFQRFLEWSKNKAFTWDDDVYIDLINCSSERPFNDAILF